MSTDTGVDREDMVHIDNGIFSQFSCSVLSDSLQPHGLQYARLSSPSPTPETCSNSFHWVGDAIQPSHPVVPFSHLQSFPASGSFTMSQFFTLGGQSVWASSSASVLPVNIQDWFPLGLTGSISFQSKELSGVFSKTTVQKHQFFGAQPSLWSDSHIHTWLLFIRCSILELEEHASQRSPGVSCNNK